MAHRLVPVAGAIVLVVALKMLLNLFMSPADAVRAELAAELATVPDHAPLSGAGSEDYAALCNPILSKPSLWHELVAAPAPPPAPKAAAPAPPNAPDVAGMLKELGMVRGQIGGNKMRVVTPEAPEGTWMAVGDSFNGCTLESFTREEAVFRYSWKEGGRDLRVTLPRPVR